MAYFFRLPLITELTAAQQAALDDPRPIAITGGPGTGKSVVALWRHIRNYGTGGNQSLLLTYTKTLEHYLTLACVQEQPEAGRHVSRIFLWTTYNAKPYDEIIVDEAQDVGKDKYDAIKEYSNLITYGADDQQIVYPSNGMNQAVLAELFPNNIEYLLDENFRNTFEIMSFIKWVFPNNLIDQNDVDSLPGKGRNGPLPIYHNCNGRQDLEIKIILEIIQRFESDTHNIAVLVPFKKNVEYYHGELVKKGINASSYQSEDADFEELKNIHVTTFKSSKGVEFDTVIIPNFDKRNYILGWSHLISENDYFVALSRAKRNLFLLGQGPLVGASDNIVRQEAVQ